MTLKEIAAGEEMIDIATMVAPVPDIVAPGMGLDTSLSLNTRLKMDGLDLLATLPARFCPVVFFDPQYRGLLDKLRYGNEGTARGRKRCVLPQMSEEVITAFIDGICRILTPSGHLFLWIDKFHLCQGIASWLGDSNLAIVDLITWSKQRMGMGYRTRRCAEYLIVLQASPRKAKGVWRHRAIPDVWDERVDGDYRRSHPHCKPVGLQTELIKAVSCEGDIVVDPAAGSFSVMAAALAAKRNFLGCDVNE